MQSTNIPSGTTFKVVNDDQLKSAFREMYAEIRAEVEAELEAKQSDRLLTPGEAVIQLNTSKVTLWRWAKCGYLTPVRIGGKVLYRQMDIENIKKGGVGR